MSDRFETIAWPWLLAAEGGLSMDPHDPGNWTGGRPNVGELKGTKYGISAKSYPELDIAKLTLDHAREIYRIDFWQKIRGDELPPAFALAVMDCAVNQGPGKAARLFQIALRTPADGAVGPVTIAAAKGASLDAILPRFQALRDIEYLEDRNAGRYGAAWLERSHRLTLACAKLAASATNEPARASR